MTLTCQGQQQLIKILKSFLITDKLFDRLQSPYPRTMKLKKVEKFERSIV